MPEFGRRIDGPNGRRRSARKAVTLAASAWAIEGSHSVLIADVSRTGARLQGRDLPPVAAEVLITFGSLELFATVTWQTSDECGIEFETSLTPELLRKLQEQGDWALVTGLRR